MDHNESQDGTLKELYETIDKQKGLVSELKRGIWDNEDHPGMSLGIEIERLFYMQVAMKKLELDMSS